VDAADAGGEVEALREVPAHPLAEQLLPAVAVLRLPFLDRDDVH